MDDTGSAQLVLRASCAQEQHLFRIEIAEDKIYVFY